jgi:hypothetical protein
VKYGKNIVLAFLVVVLAFSVMGCSRTAPPTGPTDAEALKAIEDSGRLKSRGFTVIPPIVVVEKGKMTQDGAWPVRVKIKLSAVMPNGKTKQMETSPIFRIIGSKDSSGKIVWKATQ